MKRWLLLAALVVAISATATVAVQYLPTASTLGEGPEFPVAPKISGPVPKVVVDRELTYRFDTKPQHEKFERDWVIRNEGDADLILQRARSTCSCTVAEFETKPGEADASELRIKPGGSVTLHLTFETREFDGPYEKSATVATNDPRQPELTFAAKGTIHPALVLFPPSRTVEFGTISNDTDHSTRLALASPDRPDFKVIKVTTSKPGVLVAKVEPLPDEERTRLKVQGGYRVDINVKPGLPLGLFREVVIVETDHPREPELRLTVFGKVVGPITMIPEHVRMLNVNSSDGGRGEVTLIVRGLRATKFSVEHKPEQVRVDIAPTDGTSQGKYRLTVIVPPGTPPEEIEDQIVLKTDHPQAAVVTIPVTIFILETN